MMRIFYKQYFNLVGQKLPVCVTERIPRLNADLERFFEVIKMPDTIKLIFLGFTEAAPAVWVIYVCLQNKGAIPCSV